MDDDLLKSMFLRARDQYESAVRWAFIVLLICLLFHLTTFSQFVRLGKQLKAVKAEMTRLSSLEPTIASLKTNLNQLEGSVMKSLDARLGRMLSDLRSDFEGLDRSVAQFRTPVTLQFTAIGRGDLLGEDLQSNTAIQAAPAGPPKTKTFKLGESLKPQIEGAKNVDELREVMLPVIEEKIVRPRFDQLNSYWQGEALPNIELQAEGIREDVRESKPLFPKGKVLWDEIDASLEQTVSVAAALEFHPPADPYWWASVAGKQAVLTDIGRAAADQLRAVADSEAIVELGNQVRVALDRQKELEDALQENLEQIEESFDRQQSRLSTLGRPFEVLSLDVDVVVSRFPLLLGIVLAAITIWQAYRLREIAWTMDAMARRGDEKVPWEWFFSRSWLSLSGPQAVSSDSVWRRLWPGNWSWMSGSLARGLIYWIWIGIAAWEMAGWRDVSPGRAIMFATGGCLAVAAALGYRWYVIRSSLALSKRLP